jgi:hypothetical protein
MATATSKAKTKADAVQEESQSNDPQADQTTAEAKEATRLREENEDALETLELTKVEPKRWLIGKPPERGGTEDLYSVYIQHKLGYMARMRFFALVGNTIADAIKAGGSISFGGSSDIFSGGGSLRSRAAQLSTEDFADAASFMALALQLIAFAPDFLLDCYVIILDVPAAERTWAKMVFEQPYDPDNDHWGLSEDTGLEIIEVFIDQNYEDIRDFFVVKLPRLAQRVRDREAARKARESESAQSKQ